MCTLSTHLSHAVRWAPASRAGAAWGEGGRGRVREGVLHTSINSRKGRLLLNCDDVTLMPDASPLDGLTDPGLRRVRALS